MMKTPTPYDDLNIVLADFVSDVQRILGDNFIGAYLQGSFATGDFDRHSDVDFIVLVEDDLSGREVSALKTMHDHLHDREIAWAKHLEGSYVPKTIFAQYADCSEKLWYIDNGSRDLIQSTHCNTVIVRTVVRDMSITLAGSPARDIVAPVPVNVLRQYIADDMREWITRILSQPDRFNNVFYQQFILHSYCRMLHDFINGMPGSKRAGTVWAKANFDEKWHALIDRSWATRGNSAVTMHQPADPEDFQATLDFVQLTLQKLGTYDYLLDT